MNCRFRNSLIILIFFASKYNARFRSFINFRNFKVQDFRKCWKWKGFNDYEYSESEKEQCEQWSAKTSLAVSTLTKNQIKINKYMFCKFSFLFILFYVWAVNLLKTIVLRSFYICILSYNVCKIICRPWRICFWKVASRVNIIMSSTIVTIISNYLKPNHWRSTALLHVINDVWRYYFASPATFDASHIATDVY